MPLIVVCPHLPILYNSLACFPSFILSITLCVNQWQFNTVHDCTCIILWVTLHYLQWPKARCLTYCMCYTVTLTSWDKIIIMRYLLEIRTFLKCHCILHSHTLKFGTRKGNNCSFNLMHVHSCTLIISIHNLWYILLTLEQNNSQL